MLFTACIWNQKPLVPPESRCCTGKRTHLRSACVRLWVMICWNLCEMKVPIYLVVRNSLPFVQMTTAAQYHLNDFASFMGLFLRKVPTPSSVTPCTINFVKRLHSNYNTKIRSPDPAHRTHRQPTPPPSPHHSLNTTSTQPAAASRRLADNPPPPRSILYDSCPGPCPCPCLCPCPCPCPCFRCSCVEFATPTPPLTRTPACSKMPRMLAKWCVAWCAANDSSRSSVDGSVYSPPAASAAKHTCTGCSQWSPCPSGSASSSPRSVATCCIPARRSTSTTVPRLRSSYFSTGPAGA